MSRCVSSFGSLVSVAVALLSFANKLKRCHRTETLTQELLVGQGFGFGFVPAIAQLNWV